jgi:hypothetical protein
MGPHERQSVHWQNMDKACIITVTEFALISVDLEQLGKSWDADRLTVTQVGVGDFHPDHEVVAVEVSNPFILHLFLLKQIWVCELSNYSGLVPSSLVFPDISDTGSRGEGFSEYESTSVKVSRKLALWWWRQIHFPKCCVWKNLKLMYIKKIYHVYENTQSSKYLYLYMSSVLRWDICYPWMYCEKTGLWNIIPTSYNWWINLLVWDICVMVEI